ncbi:MFS transporter [Yinghuangia seranimata]|uniref:MFS transporter n=1 Tax=Yinghuangia seranimata TaxID=408067 RepID=UPI00248C1E4A|nr:MFS transporter [Yinghuangia seranimata]MDI2130901.1 MFS transporter [Yinghuangia seranimata]
MRDQDSASATIREPLPVPEPPAPPRQTLWQNQDFLRFWLGETLSLLGTHVTTLALPLTAIYAFDATDEQVGLLRFVQLAPFLFLALLFGVWVDRARRRSVMLAANLTRLVLLALIPTLYWLDALSLVPLLVIACAIGVATVLFDVSWMSYVPTLVKEPEHYVEASSKMGVASSTADVAGPGIAGVLVSAMTAPVALIVDAGSYLVSVVSLLLIRTKEPRPGPPEAERHLLTELRDGVRWVFGDPVLRALALVGACANFSLVGTWTMFLLYGTRDVGLGSETLGAIFSAASVGGLIGALIAQRVIGRYRLGRVYFVFQTMLFTGPLLIPLADGPRPLMVAMFVASFFTTYFGLGVAGVIVVAVRQTSTPQAMMGRMTACFRTLLFGGGSLGGLSAGLLSGALGGRGALTVGAIASASVLIALLLSPVSRLAALPEPAEPAAAPAPRAADETAEPAADVAGNGGHEPVSGSRRSK